MNKVVAQIHEVRVRSDDVFQRGVHIDSGHRANELLESVCPRAHINFDRSNWKESLGMVALNLDG